MKLAIIRRCHIVILCLFATASVADDVDYARDVKHILKSNCYACHGALKQEAGLRLDTGPLIRRGGDSGAIVIPGNVKQSLLIERVTAADESERMPPEGEPLTAKQIDVIKAWIAAGAKSPAGETPQEDPRKHWAFQPLHEVEIPGDRNRHPIDAFIQARLQQAGLKPSQPADALTLIRRLFLDLHGLPPTPNEIVQLQAKLNSPKVDSGRLNDQAVKDLVNTLLDSPRYGERWAQHWLDVVRYADTHGYEVNTPRPNAWPYRDYVIRAFNEDKPYDRFVFEQLAGDSVSEDAATGFMVAAAVLLPGQIGKDEESKRLARQDALDEIIVGTSATFLGLTVGCARCHNHKFDPITQRDYYSMQAFFAGVQYGDRELRNKSQEKRLARAAELVPRINELKVQLTKFEPTAFTGRTIVIDDEDPARVTSLTKKNGHGTNPAGTQRGYKNDVGSSDRVANLSRGRYTWWNNKPGENVFTWNPGVAGRFRLWISWGAHGSGVHTRDARYVIDDDGKLETTTDQQEIARVDQYYFAGVSEGDSEKKALWSGLLDVGVHELKETSRIILRGGETGTGITADAIVLQSQLSEQPETRLPRLRAPVDAAHNVERLASVEAKFVRFTTFETIDNNRHEPCIDELEVFTAGKSPSNIALASHGTKPTSSGNYSDIGIHQLKHVNNGKYGNSQSWISNKKGGGWVQLEFPQPATIDRIEWARDREGKYKDRLAVRYKIEVSLNGSQWATVALSDDRAAIGTPHDNVKSLLRNRALNVPTDILSLVVELDRLTKQKTELEKPQTVYGGVFRKPDVTHVLRRGDPEQRLERIGPNVPKALGSISLALDEAEQQRRIALAKWIVGKDNPLTARVIVNRIWQYHFGRGLVDTPSDFGMNGARPSHPDLLDWLAHEFIENGWSIKHLHRLILSSDTYRQSSRNDKAAQAADGDCRLLWRFPRRRLEAEAIRDSMLYVSGQLNLQMGGPGFNFFKTRGGLSGFPPIEEFKSNELRRMIYAHKIRMEPVPVFGAFDCPDAGQAMPKRSRSTTAIQALNLFNSRFVADQAEAFAARVKSETKDSVDQQIDRAFLLITGRQPTDVERAASVSAIADHGLAVLCRVLFNSNEFLFLP